MTSTLLADEQFIRLTTYKRDGTAVATTVWCVGEGDDLLVTTLDTTGKAKRIRHTSRVSMVASSRTGEVAEGATSVPGDATLFDDQAGLKGLSDLLIGKYGLMARGMFAVRTLTRKDNNRIGIRISVPASTNEATDGTNEATDGTGEATPEG